VRYSPHGENWLRWYELSGERPKSTGKMGSSPIHSATGGVALSRILLLAGQGKEDLENRLRVGGQPPHSGALARTIQMNKDWRASGRSRRDAGENPPTEEKSAGIVAATLQTKQPSGMNPLELPDDGREQGVSKNTVNRLWQEYNLKPHLSRTFKLSAHVALFWRN